MWITLIASGAFIAGVLFWVAVAAWMEARRLDAERERALDKVDFPCAYDA